jgi:hypothetical protein
MLTVIFEIKVEKAVPTYKGGTDCVRLLHLQGFASKTKRAWLAEFAGK